MLPFASSFPGMRVPAGGTSAYPQVIYTNASGTSYTGAAPGGTDTHPFNFGGTTSAGDLVILIISSAKIPVNAVHTLTISGWTTLHDAAWASGANYFTRVFYKVSSGGESTVNGTYSITTCIDSYNAYVIRGFSDSPVMSTVANGGSNKLGNPPSFTSGFTANSHTLWIPWTSGFNTGNYTSGPSGYTDLIKYVWTSSMAQASARLESQNATEDPGTFLSVTNHNWNAGVIAVKGV